MPHGIKHPEHIDDNSTSVMIRQPNAIKMTLRAATIRIFNAIRSAAPKHHNQYPGPIFQRYFGESQRPHRVHVEIRASS